MVALGCLGIAAWLIGGCGSLSAAILMNAWSIGNTTGHLPRAPDQEDWGFWLVVSAGGLALAMVLIVVALRKLSAAAIPWGVRVIALALVGTGTWVLAAIWVGVAHRSTARR